MGMTSVRMPDELISKLEDKAQQLRRSKSWIINDAVREYLQREDIKAQHLQETQEALADVKSARVIDGEAVMEWLSSWGEQDEGKLLAHETSIYAQGAIRFEAPTRVHRQK